MLISSPTSTRSLELSSLTNEHRVVGPSQTNNCSLATPPLPPPPPSPLFLAQGSVLNHSMTYRHHDNHVKYGTVRLGVHLGWRSMLCWLTPDFLLRYLLLCERWSATHARGACRGRKCEGDYGRTISSLDIGPSWDIKVGTNVKIIDDFRQTVIISTALSSSLIDKRLLYCYSQCCIKKVCFQFS